MFIDGVASRMIATFHGLAEPKDAVEVAVTVTEVLPKTRMKVVGTVAVCTIRTAFGLEGETAFPSASLTHPDLLGIRRLIQGVVTFTVTVPSAGLTFAPASVPDPADTAEYLFAKARALSSTPVL